MKAMEKILAREAAAWEVLCQVVKSGPYRPHTTPAVRLAHLAGQVSYTALTSLVSSYPDGLGAVEFLDWHETMVEIHRLQNEIAEKIAHAATLAGRPKRARRPARGSGKEGA